ncbi:MAG: hypothetical protein H7146_03855 [Burkholderiaceae bacterium]|nr:hypothetical protein [Microbacteriaceae bacterium]
MENFWANAAFSVTPTILVGLIFWLVIASILKADRTERKVYSEMETAERLRRDLERANAADAPGSMSTPPSD